MRMRSPILALFGIFLATPVFAIDSCLVGVWEADGADMAQVIGTQMQGRATHVSGRTSIEIDAFGSLKILSEDMKYEIVAEGGPLVTVTVNGFGEGAMNADDGRTFMAALPDYNLIARAEVMGQVMNVPINQGVGGAGPGNTSGTYGCSGGSASFEADVLGTIPRRWTRVR